MSQEKAYRCEICDGQIVTASDDAIPECCGRSMRTIPLDQCTVSATAEHARFDQEDDACDDGRSG